jgi:hypothetical protein
MEVFMLRLISIGLLMALSGTLSATLAVRLELDELKEASCLIVLARVESRSARWDDAGTGIWTHHTLAVSETLKGDHEAGREFVTRGGVVNNRGQHVAGAGSFPPGGEYVFFFWRDDDGRYRLTGMVQGAFRITREQDEIRARNGFTGLTILDRETLQPVPGAPHDFALAELRKRLAEEAGE